MACGADDSGGVPLLVCIEAKDERANDPLPGHLGIALSQEAVLVLRMPDDPGGDSELIFQRGQAVDVPPPEPDRKTTWPPASRRRGGGIAHRA